MVSLDTFEAPSPLPLPLSASQDLISGSQSVLNELATSIQTDGTKVRIATAKLMHGIKLLHCMYMLLYTCM